jgi:nucleotide-binding universal stress UspA family protein
VDGSPLAETPLEVLARTRLAAGEIVLLHVFTPALVRGRAAAYRDLGPARARTEGYLERLRRRLIGRGVAARVVTVSGDPAQEIVRAATRERAGLVAMGTHGRTGLRRALLGSVAADVLRRSPVPVLLVGPGRRRPPIPGAIA